MDRIRCVPLYVKMLLNLLNMVLKLVQLQQQLLAGILILFPRELGTQILHLSFDHLELGQGTILTLPDDLLHLGNDIIKFGGLSFRTVTTTFLSILDLFDLSAHYIFSIVEKFFPIE